MSTIQSTNHWKNKLLEEALLDKEKIVADRRHLHSHPETGFDLTDTKTYVAKQLTEMGYEVQSCGKAGLIACAGRNNTGENIPSAKTFLLRADMDALPIKEEADLAFASGNGNMHACGHDMHTTMLLEAARILKAHEKELAGTVKLMFQPAEEILEGAKDMINSGVLKNPTVDAGMMLHVMAGTALPTGTAIVSDGGVSAPAADYFTIKIQGNGCHGSMPHMGIDPINVAAHIVLALQEIHARELSISDKAVLTIGSFQAGNAGNVIPDTATLQGTLRAYEEDVRNMLKDRMTEIVTHTAAAFRADAFLTFTNSCPTLQNDPSLSEKALQYIGELLGPHKTFSTSQLNNLSDTGARKSSKSSGSEDFAYVSHEIPTIMVALAAGDAQAGFSYPLHHPKVQFDEDALHIGAAIYAYVAMRWLEEHK